MPPPPHTHIQFIDVLDSTPKAETTVESLLEVSAVVNAHSLQPILGLVKYSTIEKLKRDPAHAHTHTNTNTHTHTQTQTKQKKQPTDSKQ